MAMHAVPTERRRVNIPILVMAITLAAVLAGVLFFALSQPGYVEEAAAQGSQNAPSAINAINTVDAQNAATEAQAPSNGVAATAATAAGAVAGVAAAAAAQIAPAGTPPFGIAGSLVLMAIGLALAAGLMLGANTLSQIRHRTEDAIIVSRSKHASK